MLNDGCSFSLDDNYPEILRIIFKMTMLLMVIEQMLVLVALKKQHIASTEDQMDIVQRHLHDKPL